MVHWICRAPDLEVGKLTLKHMYCLYRLHSCFFGLESWGSRAQRSDQKGINIGWQSELKVYFMLSSDLFKESVKQLEQAENLHPRGLGEGSVATPELHSFKPSCMEFGRLQSGYKMV